MNLQYGEIVSVSDGRAVVRLSGYAEDVSVGMVLLHAGGASSVKSWISPQKGDCVAVLVDEERIEDSCVIGGVYTDAQTAPKSGSVAAIQAPEVFLGSSMASIQKASRDDRVQRELEKIRAELDLLTASFNSHTHTIPALVVNGASPTPLTPSQIGITVTGSTATGLPQHVQSYVVAATASDSVYVK